MNVYPIVCLTIALIGSSVQENAKERPKEAPFVVIFDPMGNELRNSDHEATAFLSLTKRGICGFKGDLMLDDDKIRGALRKTSGGKKLCIVYLSVNDQVSKDGIYLTMTEFYTHIEKLRALRDVNLATHIYAVYVPSPDKKKGE